MSIKLPEPIKISKKIANELDELERKGETIVRVCGQANIEALFYLYLIKKYKSNCVAKKISTLRRDNTILGISIDIKNKLTKQEDTEIREDFANLAKTIGIAILNHFNTTNQVYTEKIHQVLYFTKK